jgi:hypothetical protein
VPYMRTVKTTSGATAVQVVWSSRHGSREIEHMGSAHDEAELEALKAAAQQRIAAGQLELGLGLGSPGPSATADHLLTDEPPGGRPGAGYRCWGSRTRSAETRCSAIWCWPGRRVPRAGVPRERRLGPQITIGLLTGQDGFPSWSAPLTITAADPLPTTSAKPSKPSTTTTDLRTKMPNSGAARGRCRRRQQPRAVERKERVGWHVRGLAVRARKDVTCGNVTIGTGVALVRVAPAW